MSETESQTTDGTETDDIDYDDYCRLSNHSMIYNDGFECEVCGATSEELEDLYNH